MYTQCLLKKNNTTQVSWVPKKFALKNKIVKLKIEDRWDEGWQIIEVYTDANLTQTPEHAFKKHKGHTGDSIKKTRRTKS